MLSRTHLRVEALFHLFAFYSRTHTNKSVLAYTLVADNQLHHSLESTLHTLRSLHCGCLQLLVEWAALDKAKCNALRAKRVHHLGELKLLQGLVEDNIFQELRLTYPLPWDPSVVEKLYYEALQEASLMHTYRNQACIGSEKEVVFLQRLVIKVLFKHKTLQAFLSRQDICWHQHFLIIRKLLLDTIATLAHDPKEGLSIYTQDLSPAKRSFYDNLISQILAKNGMYDEWIQAQAPQWDADRIAFLDRVLIKMALVEIGTTEKEHIGAIMHAYLELAKRYANPQSLPFINGVVDGLAKAKGLCEGNEIS